MKAIVTGSGGLIGSQCARMLAGQGWDVVGVDEIVACNLLAMAVR
jgi:NAD(P)-dependent dehydrogenase (short-subunit alcohol dehydrogenase family)